MSFHVTVNTKLLSTCETCEEWRTRRAIKTSLIFVAHLPAKNKDQMFVVQQLDANFDGKLYYFTLLSGMSPLLCIMFQYNLNYIEFSRPAINLRSSD